MNNIIRPTTVFYVPMPAPSAVTKAAHRSSGERAAEWVNVEKPEPDAVAEASSLRMDFYSSRNSKIISHLATSLYDDSVRLGAKRLAQVNALHISVFAAEARAALVTIHGPKMRQFYRDVAKPDTLSLKQQVGVGLVDLDHFCENFKKLQAIQGDKPLGHPEILQVAARFLGDDQLKVPTFTQLCAMAERRLESLRPVVLGLQKSRAHNLGAAAEEVLGLYRLVVLLAEALEDDQVQVLLTPPAPLPDQAKAAGLWLADRMVSGVQQASDALSRRLQQRDATASSL